jgi:hypothetical protein
MKISEICIVLKTTSRNGKKKKKERKKEKIIYKQEYAGT